MKEKEIKDFLEKELKIIKSKIFYTVKEIREIEYIELNPDKYLRAMSEKKYLEGRGQIILEILDLVVKNDKTKEISYKQKEL